MAINYLNNFNYSNAIGVQYANSNPCPDQLVGTLASGIFSPNNSRTDIDYQVNNNNYFIKNTLVYPIVIILESPHIKEYHPQTRQALGPAMGKTGNNFTKYFTALIGNSKLNTVICSLQCDIIFVNAIQYQCSLGNKLNGKSCYKNKVLRDKNWLCCFNNNFSNDLVSRVSAIKPHAVINLCTIGTKNLQLYVDRKVNSFKNYTIGNHPSIWCYGIGVIQ